MDSLNIKWEVKRDSMKIKQEKSGFLEHKMGIKMDSLNIKWE